MQAVAQMTNYWSRNIKAKVETETTTTKTATVKKHHEAYAVQNGNEVQANCNNYESRSASSTDATAGLQDRNNNFNNYNLL